MLKRDGILAAGWKVSGDPPTLLDPDGNPVGPNEIVGLREDGSRAEDPFADDSKPIGGFALAAVLRED